MINTKNIAVKLPMDIHKEFMQYCKDDGTTANAKLKGWINSRDSVDSIVKPRSTALPMVASFLVGLPLGIYVANEIKDRVKLNHPEYTSGKINLISTGYGALAGTVVSLTLFTLFRELV